MSKPLPFCLIKLEPFEVGVAKTLDLEVGGRTVIYGQSVRPRIEVQSGQLETDLDVHKGDVIGALRLSEGKAEQTRFVTVGADKKLMIWNVHGQVLGQLSGHKKAIAGVWELTGNRLASWSKDKKLIVWDTEKPGRIHRIRTRARTVEDIFVATGEDCFFITEWWWRTRIVSTQVQRRTLLKKLVEPVLQGQSEPVTGVRKLGSGAWITKSKSGMSLWTAKGALVSSLPVFSFDDGYFEYPKTHAQAGCTFIVDDLHQLHLLAASGGRLGVRAADEAMSGALRAYLRGQAQANKAIKADSTYKQFGFRDNPFCDILAPGEEAKKPTPKQDVPANNAVWHFFQRPRYEAVQSWLQADLKAARDARTRANNAIIEHRARIRRTHNYTFLAWASLSPSTLVLIVARDRSQLWAALFAGLLSIGIALWLKSQARVLAAAERTLSGLPKQIGDFLHTAEAQRASMRAALPCVEQVGVYDGRDVRAHIHKVIAGEITNAAWTACRLERVDLITQGQKPIILRDWSLLAVSDHPSQVTPNLRAFWWGRDGRFLVAMERVHVVLPTWDLLHVFSLDYDYASNQSYNATTHTFYYCDVANIIIRDVLRSVALPAGATTVSAKELLIVLSSGETAAISALHETSAHALRQAAISAAGATLENRRRNLETELNACNTAFRDHVQTELDALQLELLTGPAQKDTARQGAEAAMNYIKQLILMQRGRRKQPPGDQPWPPLWGGQGDDEERPRA